ncbi:2-dehydro-3-deoxygluconokinase [Brevundimonas alba]|uniref:2-dehydro-3-deoxygluconokinase n=1 Tax=Brevundimonas alba TaxID=74314 RepID=A0A7X5YNB3_9CAUL|nr:sugar kinase [Brevundimonas alba]NJC41680.1 2-dehydro-3-deoxygluconokinase [Brevundimonas alba]
MTDLLALRRAEDCRWDCVALGEVMLRLDPGEGRIRTARSFQVWEGGGEYNVARGLRKTFGLRTSVVTALPRNEPGALCEDLILQGGVDTSHILWREADGVGRNTRMGLNFTERGFGVRAALGVSDRANSAASQMHPAEVDWDALFGGEGVRWLHTGGIFAALSESTAETTLAAIRAAKQHGVVVSYDLNYRASLWSSHPDPDAARRVNREIAGLVDVLVGDEYAWASCLGVQSDDARADSCDSAPFDRLVQRVAPDFPNVKVFAATLRDPLSASVNRWGAVLWAGGLRYEAPVKEIAVLDRVGGGDGFVSGMAWAFLTGRGPQAAVELGAAHGALAMTTPGDNAMTSLSEVEAVAAGGGAAAIR